MKIHALPDSHDLTNLAEVHYNLPTSFLRSRGARTFLHEEVVRRREGRIAHLGPLIVQSGHHMGRAPEDKFVAGEPSSEDKVWSVHGGVLFRVTQQSADRLPVSSSL